MTKEQVAEQCRQTREVREAFFEAIVDAINTPAGDIDRELNQSEYYVAPLMEQVISRADMGTLFIPFEIADKRNPEEIHRMAYSLFQSGDNLKLGVVFYDKSLYGAPHEDSEDEMKLLWDSEPLAVVRGDGLMYEWSMQVPDLYEKWVRQERIILGMRHMHFRVMRIVSSQLEK